MRMRISFLPNIRSQMRENASPMLPVIKKMVEGV